MINMKFYLVHKVNSYRSIYLIYFLISQTWISSFLFIYILISKTWISSFLFIYLFAGLCLHF